VAVCDIFQLIGKYGFLLNVVKQESTFTLEVTNTVSRNPKCTVNVL
jgi:hypothetical protein